MKNKIPRHNERAKKKISNEWSAEACEVLINKQVFDYDHRILQKYYCIQQNKNNTTL